MKIFHVFLFSVAVNASCLCASVLIPISYQVSEQLADGPYYYPDNGSLLTDGKAGLPFAAEEPVDGWGWVGWWSPRYPSSLTSPSIAFDFGSSVSIRKVSINVLRWDEAAVYLPKQVKIQNQLFSVASEALLNQSSGWLDFFGVWDTSILNVSVEDVWKRGSNPGNPRPTGAWSFVGEVVVSEVPEPYSLSLLVLGGVFVALVGRRK
jgi:hypothetical protein